MSPSLSLGTVQLWHASSASGDPGPLEHWCEACLDESDRRRAAELRLAKVRNQHVVGRGMARRLLAGDDHDPSHLRFDAELHGKPFVREPRSACRLFNVAHTDGLVLCGLGAPGHRCIGVDVERLDRRTDPELAQRYFAPPEVAYLEGIASDRRRRETFLRIWTLKESFIKAIGTGLQTPLADFAFEEIESDQPRIRMLNPELLQGRQWRFFSLQPRPGYIASVAVATEEPGARCTVQLHRFDDLLPRDR